MRLSSLRRKLADADLVERLAEIDNVLEESVRESRSLAVELSPPMLYDRGLVAALGWLAERMQRQHGLQVELRAPEDVPLLDGPVAALVFQATRELLFNVVKHAAASRAILDVHQAGPHEVCVVVADDGRGFDVPQQEADAEASFGLFSIRQRIAWIGGRLEIESSVGEGTRVTLCVPTQTRPQPSTEGAEPTAQNSSTRAIEK